MDERRESFCNINEDNEELIHDGQDDSVDSNVAEIDEEAPPDSADVVLPQHMAPKQGIPTETIAKKGTDQNKKMTFRDKISFTIENCSEERDKIIKSLLQKEEETDDISLFFKSIAKTVQKMPPTLQQRAKLETLNLISKIESDMWASNQGITGRDQMFTLSSPSPSTSDVKINDAVCANRYE